MKKFLLSIVAMMLAAPSFAQFSSGGFSLNEESLYWGIRIGLTSATVSGDEGYGSLGAKAGMTLGGVVGIRVAETTPLFIESGLYYTERGAKKDKAKVGINYLEVPILIKYGFKATDDIAILPFVGPYFSYGVSGKVKNAVFVPGAEAVNERSSFNNVGFKHMDMGFKLGVGAEYNRLYLELGYQFGVKNIAKPEGVTAHGNAFMANFGVNF